MVDAVDTMDEELLLCGVLPRVCDNIWKENNFKFILDYHQIIMKSDNCLSIIHLSVT